MSADIVNIADRGDAILVVGQSDNIVRLKVDSHILRAASKTFKIMFGPDFAEGRDLNYDAPKEISLSDDDANAMELVCKVVHLKQSDIATELPSKTVLDIAQIVDKYSLHEALKFALASWIQVDKVKESTDLGNMLKAASLLKQRAAYKSITKSLVMNHTDSYQDFLDEGSSDLLIRTVGKNAMFRRHLDLAMLTTWLCFLEQKRDQLRAVLNQAIFDILTFNIIEQHCICNNEYIKRLLIGIIEHKLQPKNVAIKPLSSCLSYLTSIAKHSGISSTSCDIGRGSRSHTPQNLYYNLKNKLLPLQDFDGLILDDN